MAYSPKEAAFIHGEYISPSVLEESTGDRSHDAYVAVIKPLDGKRPSEIRIIDDPEVPIYITKPGCRVNTVKKEFEEKSKLDMYRTPYKDIPQTIWKALNNTYTYGGRQQWQRPPMHLRLKQMQSNPYVYGADIDLGVHIKMAYKKANGGKMPMEYNIGFFDIETDVNGTNQIILITFMNGDGETYVGILREFFLGHTEQEVIDMWNSDVEPSLRSKLNKDGMKAYEKAGGIRLHVQICDGEVNLIKWVFDKIHMHKPDFIGVWNMSFDIPYILKRLEFRGIDPRQIFCSAEVPWKYRYCKYKDDPGKPGGHLVDRWPWFHCTSFTRWIDSLMLYGRIRKAKPREPSYKLDAIGGKEIGSGKLEFGSGETHSTMQRFHQVKYTVYNIVDVLIMWIMCKKNHDVRSMMMLINDSMLDSYAHQSVMLKDYFYDYLGKKNCVTATIGNRIDDPWDYLIHNIGGAVLDPSKADIAVPVLKEDDIVVRASRDVCDIDVSSMYPSLLELLNCSKETKLCTVLSIDNTKRRGTIKLRENEDKEDPVILDKARCPGYKHFDVTAFFTDAIYTEANAIEVGKRFSLPGFDGIVEYMKRKHPTITERSRAA